MDKPSHWVTFFNSILPKVGLKSVMTGMFCLYHLHRLLTSGYTGSQVSAIVVGTPSRAQIIGPVPLNTSPDLRGMSVHT